MSKHNFPHEAIQTIYDTLEVGKQKGYTDGYWRTLSSDHHFSKAFLHMNAHINATNPDEDNLAHALTRLAMAVSMRK